jgi:hypothetical protein
MLDYGSSGRDTLPEIRLASGTPGTEETFRRVSNIIEMVYILIRPKLFTILQELFMTVVDRKMVALERSVYEKLKTLRDTEGTTFSGCVSRMLLLHGIADDCKFEYVSMDGLK